MDRIGKFLQLVVGIALAAFALPSVAQPSQEKLYELTVTTTASTLTAAFSNTSPGNSNINSVRFIVMETPGPANVPLDLAKYQVLLDGANVTSKSSITVVQNPTGVFTVSVTGFPSVRPPNHVLSIVITMPTPECGSVTYDSKAHPGNFATEEFRRTKLTAPCQSGGFANCGAPIGAGNAAGKRGLFDKHGGLCAPVNYSFTFDPDLVRSLLLWTGDANAIFSYSLVGDPEDVDTDTGYPKDFDDPQRRPKVSWTFDANGDPTNVAFGVACLRPELAAPYATLVGAVNATTTSININVPTILPATSLALPSAPFPIIIQSSANAALSERLQVTGVAAVIGQPHTHTLQVMRGMKDLNVPLPGPDAAPHANGALVMSTSMPYDPNPVLPLSSGGGSNAYYNKQVSMCIWDVSWTSSGIKPGSGFPGIQQVRRSVSAHDGGDGILLSR